jgi:Arc/MetJ family transcription regulator
MNETLAAWLAWATTITALAVIVWALVGTRPVRHRSRRCPRCRYDMEATPGRTCPECGFEPRSERALHRGRRRWRLAMLGVVVLILSHPLHAVPDINERGWVGGVPTTPLIVSLLVLRPDLGEVTSRHGRYLYAPEVADSGTERLYLDLLDARVIRNRLTGWQEWLLSGVCGLLDEQSGAEVTWETPADALIGSTRWASGRSLTWSSLEPALTPMTAETRPRWPAGVPIYAQLKGSVNSFRYRYVGEPQSAGLEPFVTVRTPGVREHRIYGAPWSDGLQRLGTPAADAGDLRFTVLLEDAEYAQPLVAQRWRCIDRQTVEIDTELSGVLGEYSTPIRSTKVESALRRTLEPRLSLGRRTLDLDALPAHIADALEPLGGATLGFRAEVVVPGGHVVATTEAWFRTRPYLTGSPWIDPIGTVIDVNIIDLEALRVAKAGSEQCILRLRGDAGVALRNFENERHWVGEVEMPVDLDP